MSYTIKNLREIDDMAPRFGFDSVLEARFPWRDLEAQDTGMAYHVVKPGQRGRAHRHDKAEEISSSSAEADGPFLTERSSNWVTWTRSGLPHRWPAPSKAGRTGSSCWSSALIMRATANSWKTTPGQGPRDRSLTVEASETGAEPGPRFVVWSDYI
jgi:hypothetical protein